MFSKAQGSVRRKAPERRAIECVFRQSASTKVCAASLLRVLGGSPRGRLFESRSRAQSVQAFDSGIEGESLGEEARGKGTENYCSKMIKMMIKIGLKQARPCLESI